MEGRIVVVGASLGGMQALARLLSALPRELSATVAAVLHRGSNTDGAEGLARIRKRGGLTIVQAPSEAECPDMPEAAIAACAVDHVLTLAEIPPLLARLCPGLTR